VPTDPRPNILLITTDQQRYDMLGAIDETQVKTPHLDALAARGALFRRAFTQNPVCIPSRACIQTGRYTHQHGVEYMESVIDDTPGLPAWELTFMERLQGAGYHTGAFGKIHMMPEKGFHEMQVTGGKGARWTKSAGLPIGLGPLGRDYAAWLEARHPGGYEAIYEQRRRPEYRKYRTAISNVLPLEEYIDYWIAENTCDFIQRDHDKPFFAWCGFCGPHGPVDPPKPYDTLYASEDVVLPANYAVDMEGNPRKTTPEEDSIARRWCAYYMGSVTLIDDMVGRIVAVLEEEGVMDNTLIVFTTDHGEMMFERGQLGKGNFFEPIIRVPLILVPPGGSATRHEIDGLVETFDIAPTVLDYAMAEIPVTMSASSLRPIVEGQADGKNLILSEYVINDRSCRGICLRTSRFKYEYWTSDRGARFFDLQEDPLERVNLIDDDRYSDRIAEHRQQMIGRLIHTPA
jgi:arylsulfatase A-like enzyme